MHDYTPKSAFIEAIAAGTFMALLPLALWMGSLFWYAEATLWLMTFLPSLHLMKFIYRKKDYAVLLLSPIIISMRAFATAFGVLFGFGGFVLKPKLKKIR